MWSVEEVEGLLCVQRSIYLDLELMDPGRGLALRSSMVGSILGGGFAWRRAHSMEGAYSMSDQG